MDTSKNLAFNYLMDMKKGIVIYQALRDRGANPKQVEKARQFVDTCESLAQVHMKIARRNTYK